MLKTATSTNLGISAAQFTEYNKTIFYDETIKEDVYTPIANKEENYIQPAELLNIIQHKFKANKSSGLSAMPL
jgi:hypothetical protein